jgi:hypothetical protein
MYRLPLLLLAGTVAFAQTSGNSPRFLKNSPAAEGPSAAVTFNTTHPDNTGCPVGFYASRKATGQIMSAGDAKQAGPAQGLHLMLNHLTAPAIESIEITVYGVSSKARVLPAGPPPEDVSKTFELRRSEDSNSLSDADVWMHNVGTLSRVDLISIHYADGTTWHSTPHLRCRVIPSNFVLVTKR